MSIQETFTDIFVNNKWWEPDSRSGPGSCLEQTAAIRRAIPELLREFGIKRMLDIPCGDFFWMKEIRTELEQILDSYHGGDIVPALIAQNQRLYQTEKIRFQVLDLTKDRLPSADMILVRDCLLHLNFRLILRALDNIRESGIKYVLLSTYTKKRPNIDFSDEIDQGGRALNLCDPPFCFPEPVVMINEGCTEQEESYADKSLGLWRVSDLEFRALRRLVFITTPLRTWKRIKARAREIVHRVRGRLRRVVNGIERGLV